MSNQFIMALSWPWVLIGVIITVLFGYQLIKLAVKRQFNDSFFFTLGIFLAWLGGGVMLRPWYTVWRYFHNEGIDVEWMLTHWVVVIGTLFVLIGGLLHIRTALHSRFSEWGWFSVFFMCLIVYVGVL